MTHNGRQLIIDQRAWAIRWSKESLCTNANGQHSSYVPLINKEASRHRPYIYLQLKSIQIGS